MADKITYLDELLSKKIAVDGTEMEPCGRLNLVAGAGVNLTGTNDAVNNSCNVTITATNLATLATSEVTNDSGVAGATAADALDALDAGKVDTTTSVNAGLGLSGGGSLDSNVTIAISTAGASVGQFLALTGAETVGWADGSSLSAPTGGDAYKVAVANATEDDIAYSSATIQGDVLSISGQQIVDASTGVVIGDAANTGSMTLEVDAVESIYLKAGSNNIVAFSDNGLSMQGSRFVNVGSGWLGLGLAKPSTGTVRMAHGSSFYGLNDAGDTDVALMDWGVTTTDLLTMPGPVQVGSGTYATTGDIRLPPGGVIAAGTSVTCSLGSSNQFVVVAPGGIILNNATSSNSSISAAGAVSSSAGGYTTQMVGSSSGYVQMSALAGQSREVRVADNTTASVTGASIILHGQNCTGATATGGDTFARAGTGTSAGGNAELQSAAGSSGNRVRVNDTGVLIVPSSTGSVQIGAAASADFGSGVGVIGIDEATTDPTGNPTSGGILYVENSTGKLFSEVSRGPSPRLRVLDPWLLLHNASSSTSSSPWRQRMTRPPRASSSTFQRTGVVESRLRSQLRTLTRLAGSSTGRSQPSSTVVASSTWGPGMTLVRAEPWLVPQSRPGLTPFRVTRQWKSRV
ncbi:MAG: hypothetical protein H6718_04055 [Polyangiaceae bacterium]|nr:hypothetical protein [Polyangiaceae bacterium]